MKIKKKKKQTYQKFLILTILPYPKGLHELWEIVHSSPE